MKKLIIAINCVLKLSQLRITVKNLNLEKEYLEIDLWTINDKGNEKPGKYLTKEKWRIIQ